MISILIITKNQSLTCYEGKNIVQCYSISTAKNGLGEQSGSECTPRGNHVIYSIIGLHNEPNSVFVSRQFTGEIYSPLLVAEYPQRDWILTRILQLDGLEPGHNKGGEVDSLARYIYIHGVPDSTPMGIPGSRGCIRMRNDDIIALASWVSIGTSVYIE